MMLTLLFVLLINIAGFGIFGRRTAKADDILRVGGIYYIESSTIDLATRTCVARVKRRRGFPIRRSGRSGKFRVW